MNSIPLNSALVKVNFSSVHSMLLRLYGIPLNCYKCAIQPIHFLNCWKNQTSDNCMTIRPNQTRYFIVQTVAPTKLHAVVKNSFASAVTEGAFFETTYEFQEFYTYAMEVKHTPSTMNLGISVLTPGPSNLHPVVIAILVLLIFSMAGCVARYIWRNKVRSNSNSLYSQTKNEQDDVTIPLLNREPAIRPRLQCLDTFRGIAMILMVFVNYGGGGYWFFTHAIWNGLTFADLVFPWFVWIMGVSMAFSFSSQLKRGSISLKLIARILSRFIKLFFIGMFLNNGWDISKWRIPGVLQMLACAYLFTSLIVLLPIRMVNNSNEYRNTCGTTFTYILWSFKMRYFEWIILCAFVAFQLLLVFAVHLPGCPNGYLGPGGISDNGLFKNCTGGSHLLVDKLIFGLHHIYQTPTCQKLYRTGAFDPEGALNWISATFMCYLGYNVGKMFNSNLRSTQRIQFLILHSILFCCLALILCKCSVDDGWIPINKNMWSLSFVFITCGLAHLVLCALFAAIDLYPVWNGFPCKETGMNAIFVYVMHELMATYFPFSYNYTKNSHIAMMTSNAIGTLCWIIVAVLLSKNDIFLKV